MSRENDTSEPVEPDRLGFVDAWGVQVTREAAALIAEGVEVIGSGPVASIFAAWEWEWFRPQPGPPLEREGTGGVYDGLRLLVERLEGAIAPFRALPEEERPPAGQRSISWEELCSRLDRERARQADWTPDRDPGMDR